MEKVSIYACTVLLSKVPRAKQSELHNQKVMGAEAAPKVTISVTTNLNNILPQVMFAQVC